MSIDKVKEAHKEFQKTFDVKYSSTAIQLLDELAKYNIQLCEEKQKCCAHPQKFGILEIKVPEGFIGACEFGKKYAFVSRNTVTRMICEDRYFRDEVAFAIKIKNTWYVDEDSVLEYLKNQPIFANRIARGTFFVQGKDDEKKD